MLYFDLLAIVLTLAFIVLIVSLFLIGSRFFPEEMLHHLWRYDGPLDRPSPKVREEEDARFNLSQHKPGDGDDR